MMSDDEKERARDLVKVFERLLDYIIADYPRADQARLKKLFAAAVADDPILGREARRREFWVALNAIRAEEERMRAEEEDR
jgi:hypothetical protein